MDSSSNFFNYLPNILKPPSHFLPSQCGHYLLVIIFVKNKKRYLFQRKSSDTGKLLALEQLKGSTTTSRNVAQLVLNTVLGSNSSGITTTDDDDLARLSSLNSSIKNSLGAVSEGVELEDTWGTVPDDSLGLSDSLLVELDGLLGAVKTHPAVGDTLRVNDLSGLSVGSELIGDDEVAGQDDLDVVGLSLLHELGDELGAGLVEDGVADLGAGDDLLEGEGHAATDDEDVDLVEEVVDELDLVGDLGTTEDGEEGTSGVLKGLAEVLELLLHEETRGLLGDLDTDHGGVSTVGSTEGVV